MLIQSFYGIEGSYQTMNIFVSEYAGKSLEQILSKIKRLNYTKGITVSVDLSVASENDKINKQLMLLEFSMII